MDLFEDAFAATKLNGRFDKNLSHLERLLRKTQKDDSELYKKILDELSGDRDVSWTTRGLTVIARRLEVIGPQQKVSRSSVSSWREDRRVNP